MSLKKLPLPKRETLLPSEEEISKALLSFWGPLDSLIEQIRLPKQGEMITEEGHIFRVVPLESIGTCGDEGHGYVDELLYFLRMPEGLMQEFARLEILQNSGKLQKFYDKYVYPASYVLAKALRPMKLPGLPGHLLLLSTDCGLLIAYVEGDVPDSYNYYG